MAVKDKSKQKEYSRKHYLANRQKMIKRARANTIATRNKLRSYVWALKESNPCTDCGEFYPHYVMDFDHIGDNKETNIAWAVIQGWSLDRLIDEIDKCELVCSNCHRERTHSGRSASVESAS